MRSGTYLRRRYRLLRLRRRPLGVGFAPCGLQEAEQKELPYEAGREEAVSDEAEAKQGR